MVTREKAIDWEGERMPCNQYLTNIAADIPPFGYAIDYMTYGGVYRGGPPAWAHGSDNLPITRSGPPTVWLVSSRFPRRLREGTVSRLYMYASVPFRERRQETQMSERVSGAEKQDGRVHFSSDSDSLLVRGVLSILEELYQGRTPRRAKDCLSLWTSLPAQTRTHHRETAKRLPMGRGMSPSLRP